MAIKFAELAKQASAVNRTIESIKDGKLQSKGLTVPVKVIKLENGVSGTVTLERWDAFKANAIISGKDGNAELKDTYKVGQKGHWFDSSDPQFAGSGKMTLVVED